MKLLFAKSKWELPDCGLSDFFAKIKKAGFDAAEVYLPEIVEKDDEVRRAHTEAGLDLVAQIVTDGDTLQAHEDVLRRLCDRAVACGAARINSHTGSDWLSFADNVRLFQTALELEEKHGIAICHETHRGRALYNAPDTVRYLRELPGLKLTADLSHWQVVHETDDMARQADAVRAVVAHAWHIHARVGCSQAAQVSDPRVSEFAPQLTVLLAIWRRILEAREAEDAGFVVITPEAGPPPYQQRDPVSGRLLADPWEVNLWMRDKLRRELDS